jgi:hypothetical protein
MPRHDGRHAVLIEAGDQLRDGIAGTTPCGVGRRRVGLPSSHGEERFGPRHMARWLTVRATEPFQRGLFRGSQWTQWVFLAAGHTAPRHLVIH